MAPHHEHLVVIVQHNGHGGLRHSQDVLLEEHSIRQLNVSDAQPVPARIVHGALIVNYPSEWVPSCRSRGRAYLPEATPDSWLGLICPTAAGGRLACSPRPRGRPLLQP